MAKLTPIKAIRKKCLDCCCGSSLEVKLCDVKKCPLYTYRFGKRPKGEESIEEKDSEAETHSYVAGSEQEDAQEETTGVCESYEQEE
jgi:hypothetical protein